MDFHGLINTGSMWVLYFQPHRLQGVQLDKFHWQTTVLCEIAQIIVFGGVTVRAYLERFSFVVEQGTTVSGYSWCQICTYPTQNDHRMSIFSFLCYFLK